MDLKSKKEKLYLDIDHYDLKDVYKRWINNIHLIPIRKKTRKYKIKNIDYASSFDINILEHKIAYSLVHSKSVKYDNNLIRIINFMINEDIYHLFKFLMTINYNTLTKLLFKLPSLNFKIITGTKNNRYKDHVVKDLCLMIFKKISNYDFIKCFEDENLLKHNILFYLQLQKKN